MKGISAVIATILLLLITVTLATVEYLYISNIIGFRTEKTFQLLSPSCTNGTISFVVSNQGTKAISNADISIIVDNKLNTTNFEENGVSGDTTYSMNPGQAVALVDSLNTTSGSHQLRITTSSDSQSVSIFC